MKNVKTTFKINNQAMKRVFKREKKLILINVYFYDCIHDKVSVWTELVTRDSLHSSISSAACICLENDY